jgi:predicted phage-related endonuclease
MPLNFVCTRATPESVWRQKAAALKGQQAAGKKDTGAMARGRQLEPVAVAEYAALMGWKVPAACGVREEYDWLKVSLDGYNPELSLFVEVKAPNREDHAGALEGLVPEKYIPQIMHQYLVSGARHAHYLSYSNYSPDAQQLAVVKVKRDEELISELFRAEKIFWECVLSGQMPS